MNPAYPGRRAELITTLRRHWQAIRSSFWFVPAMIVLGAVGLAIALIALDANLELHVDKRWPLVFGAGAAGARGLLTAVASSMITVAGVVFSITIVALSLTSSQYSSRVLGNFMRDRINQVVLGVFVGIFAYCLVVLRAIRGADEGTFVPSLAVLGGLILAFVGIAFLIFFVHHVSVSIQASSILASTARETVAAVDQLFPKGLGEGVDEDAGDDSLELPEDGAWLDVPARRTGYIESIDEDALLAFTRKHETVLRMERGIGEFVVAGSPLASLAGRSVAEDETSAELDGIYVIGRTRTVYRDVAFGIRQIVDVAMKALSPGINDSTTAVMCVDYLSAILARIAPRELASPYRFDDGVLRVIAREPSFQSLLAEALDEIRRNAERNVVVLTRMLRALETIANETTNAQRMQALRQEAGLIGAVAERAASSERDRAAVAACLARISRRGDPG